MDIRDADIRLLLLPPIHQPIQDQSVWIQVMPPLLLAAAIRDCHLKVRLEMPEIVYLKVLTESSESDNNIHGFKIRIFLCALLSGNRQKLIPNLLYRMLGLDPLKLRNCEFITCFLPQLIFQEIDTDILKIKKMCI